MELLVIEYAPKSRGGHGRNDLNFARFGFDVTFMIAYGGNRNKCAPRGRKLTLEAAAATSILDTTLSSQVWSIVCCAAVWLASLDVTQSNGLQEGSSIFLFSVSCFDEEVIFFIFWGLFREKQEHTITGVSRLLLGEARRWSNERSRRRYVPKIKKLDHLVRGRWKAVRTRSLSFPASLL